MIDENVIITTMRHSNKMNDRIALYVLGLFCGRQRKKEVQRTGKSDLMKSLRRQCLG